MRIYKSLLIGGIVLLLPALVVLLSTSPTLAISSCAVYDCTTGDGSVDDFVQGLFYATGISNLTTGGVQLSPMGLTSEWTDDIHLPSARTELAAVSYRNILYAIGGTDTVGDRHAEIFSATTYITGAIKPSGWVTPTSMPAPLSGMAAVISTTTTGGYLYIVGGYNLDIFSNNAPTSTISYIQITTGGAFTGTWHSIYNALPNPLYYASAVARNGNLYVIGGIDNLGSSSTVYRFSINASNGSLGGVTSEANPLNIPRHSAPATIWTDESRVDHLYVLGGQTTGGTTLLSVEKTTFQPDNSIGSFTSDATDQLLNTLTAHGAIQSNGRMFLTGGQEGIAQIPITKVNSALIDPTGSLHVWGTKSWVIATPLLRPRSFHGTAINSGGEIYVIGGYGDPALGEGGGTATVYHGSTNGFSSQYAPVGDFSSRVIDLTTPQPITEIDINSTITGTATMTVQYRYGNNPSSLSGWTDLPKALPYGENITTTFNVISITATVIQYRATLTSTSPYSITPILNAFVVKYPKNGLAGLPDLAVLGMDTPAATVNGSAVITIYVQNKGGSPSRPVLRGPDQVLGSSSPSARPLPRVPTGHGWFFVDVYYERIPVNAGDLGDCFGTGAGGNPGEIVKVYANCSGNGVSRNYWAQVDTCDSPANCSTNWGYIRESDETNNISGPFSSGTHYTTTIPISQTLYLPLIAR